MTSSSAELFDRAVAHQGAGRLAEALSVFDLLAARHPDVPEVQLGRGDVLMALTRFAEALAAFEAALRHRSGDATLHIKKGIALQLLGQGEEALASYDRAIGLNPRNADAHYNKATLLGEMNRLEDALASYDAALRIRPHDAKAHGNKAQALRDLKRPDEALACYDRAIALMPQSVTLRFNKALCSLALGRFAEGWPLYELRKSRNVPVTLPASAQPAWLGEQALEGKRLLVHAEQGLGDTIQFCRYAALARARGAEVILSVPKILLRLLEDSGIAAVDAASPMPDCDYHTLLLSLPLAFKTDAQTIPANIPYLRAQPARVKAWVERIGAQGFKIGIAWQGDRTVAIDAGRSIPLRHFAGLGKIPGVRLISLQKNDGIEQLTDSGVTVEQLGEGFDAGPDAFVDSAAVMESLDLIVTSDTAIAHLAGALGRPVWLALQLVPDWRWQMERRDSPWYPTMRLFRQSVRGDWSSVFRRIESELMETIAAGLPPSGGVV